MNAGRHIIIGTAGHVDHGKTALTACLTGIDTDRLPEEKRRGMTIVPGFVPLTLDSGRRLGLIDVPGHERFIKNMLAGVGGVDMALLVVAADEGVMPQTVEHLHILHLLGIEQGVVALTKADLVDEEWLAMIREQVTELLKGSSLAGAPVVAVSAVTGEGIAELRQALDQAAAEVREKPLTGHARLPIDRVFSKAGFGTVITGSLWAGKISVGQHLQLWPGGRAVRVRGLQVHGGVVEQAFAGQRTAVNLAGLEADQVERGGWLAETGLLKGSYRLDVSLRLLADARPLAQRARLRVHHGTAEALGRVELLDREQLEPGESCYAQLMLERPLPPLRGDRLVLRAYSPMLTIGGATVLDADAPRHKRFHAPTLAALTARSDGSLAAALLDLLRRQDAPLNAAALSRAAQLPQAEIAPIVADLLAAESVTALEVDGEMQYLAADTVEQALGRSLHLLTEYHHKYPLRRGLPQAELRARLFPGYKQKAWQALLARWQGQGFVRVEGAALALTDFAAEPAEAERQLLTRIVAAYAAQPFAPPEWAEVLRHLGVEPTPGGEYLLWLTESGQLIRVGELCFAAAAVAEAECLLRALDGPEGFTLAAARDALNSSRKYVQPLLEYFDERRLTRRAGDIRHFIA